MSMGSLLEIGKALNELEFANIDTVAALGNLKGMTDSLKETQDILSGSADFDLAKLKKCIKCLSRNSSSNFR